MSANNLSVAPPKQVRTTTNAGSLSKRIGFQPSPGEYNGNASAGEVEALNRILNNINVQTKKNELMGGEKLPPIKK